MRRCKAPISGTSIITLGVLVITSEYGTGMIRTTMTACPSRNRVLLAKAALPGRLPAILRHSAGAITAMLGVVLLPMLVAMFIPGEDLRASKTPCWSTRRSGLTRS